jgi:hypothetical protein
LDDTYAYFTAYGDGSMSGGSVHRVQKNGGSVDTLATGQNQPSIPVIADGILYWSAGSFINHAPVDGGAVAALQSGGKFFFGLLVVGPTAFWTDIANEAPDSGVVGGTSLRAGSKTTVASGLTAPILLAHNSKELYWGEQEVQTISGPKVRTFT